MEIAVEDVAGLQIRHCDALLGVDLLERGVLAPQARSLYVGPSNLGFVYYLENTHTLAVDLHSNLIQ